jgi:hypothetical protein
MLFYNSILNFDMIMNMMKGDRFKLKARTVQWNWTQPEQHDLQFLIIAGAYTVAALLYLYCLNSG